MALQGKPDDLSFIPGTRVVERELSPTVVFCPPPHTHIHTHSHMRIDKEMSKEKLGKGKGRKAVTHCSLDHRAWDQQPSQEACLLGR